jgi:predicted ATPase
MVLQAEQPNTCPWDAAGGQAWRMNALSSLDPLIRSVRLRRDEIPDPQAWPWSLPAVRALDDLALDPGVTFIVGQNGSGKSTLVEGIAVAAGFNPEGGTTNLNFATREDSVSPLGDLLTLVRGARRPRTGFFLRAESMFNVATEIDNVGAEEWYGIAPVAFEDTDVVRLTRDFLESPERYFRHLL